MSRLISLTITDFKRIKVAEIPVKDGLNKIVGANGAGKTSILDALASLLSGKELPDEPIREGADSAQIVGRFNDMVITRRVTKSGTTLVITNADGSAKFSKPQDLLDKLTGGPGARLFDPSKFIRESDTPDGRRAQAEQLRKLVGLDFAEIDQQKAALVSARQTAWSAANDAEATAKNLPTHADAPAEEVSSGQIFSEIDKANEQNSSNEVKARAEKDAIQAIVNHQAEVNTLTNNVENLKKQLADAEAKLRTAKLRGMSLTEAKDAAHEAVLACVNVDVTPIRAKLDTLEATNAKVRDNKAKAKAEADAKAKREKVDALQSQIKAIDAKKELAMTEAKFPIEGLSFDETGVRYKGKPFTQASDAEKIRVAVAVFAARKPDIRCMILRSGSMLDDESLSLLNSLAEEFNLQVLIELVQHSTDDEYPDGAIVIADGAVAQ